jgi:hypothetical protein
MSIKQIPGNPAGRADDAVVARVDGRAELLELVVVVAGIGEQAQRRQPPVSSSIPP